jgi:hypothetical protein
MAFELEQLPAHDRAVLVALLDAGADFYVVGVEAHTLPFSPPPWAALERLRFARLAASGPAEPGPGRDAKRLVWHLTADGSAAARQLRTTRSAA